MSQSTFDTLRRHPIDSLNLELQEYRHRVTGARHLHLAAPDPHNVFLVAFLTVPQDSTGVAHILEHTALCGSRRYPVRDPFFMMIRRSLNTFMNAFTASDWTAYPFATRNRKDFYNLLDVYLDAAFFPSLDELDFAQEGHRLEFSDPRDPNSPLVFKGVVYNEMKGAMSSPVSCLAQELQSRLFPSVTYHHNSGGDPAVIPDLTHQQLTAFHGRHYHPSNALFMSYGDIPPEDLQARFEERVLAKVSPLAVDFSIPDEQRYPKPQRFTAHYALDGDDTADRSHIVLGWLLGTNTDSAEVMRARILADVLLDNSSSPLRQALETCGLGSAPSSLCGFDDNTRETTFVCGLEGTNPEHADAVETLILDTLRRIAEEGVPQETVEAVLHQLELSQREVTGDGFPYGLQLLLTALTPTIHQGDPVMALDLDALLPPLRQEIANPGFIPGLVRTLLLDNPHRIRLLMSPDPGLGPRREAAEQARLRTVAAQLDDTHREAINQRAAALLERQNQEDDPELLPRVTLEDVPRDLEIPQGVSGPVADMPTTWFTRSTNGLAYQQLVVELPALPETLLELLPIYCLCLTEAGSDGRDYLATQALQAAVTGGISARPIVRCGIDDVRRSRCGVALSGKALARNGQALTEILTETFTAPRFDELPRLRELVAQLRAHREDSVTQSGHTLAMTAAGAGLSPTLAVTHRWSGLLGLTRLKVLDDALDDHTQLATLSENLQALHRHMLVAPRQLLVVSEASAQDELRAALGSCWRDFPTTGKADLHQPAAQDDGLHHGWYTSAQVNFCARTFLTVPPSHPDAALLQVLGDYLRYGFLHRAIREQGGAYGGGAGYHADSGTFRFFSYRDPRLGETFSDFQAALTWLMEGHHSARQLEEAILCSISTLDRPGSPAGEAITAFYGNFFGRTPEQRREFRQRVLAASLGDLRRVTSRYLSAEGGRDAAIGARETLRQRGDLELSAI